MTTENKQEEFNKLIQKIENKNDINTWNENPSRLTCCIIEPRNHSCLRGVLNNMANVYANTDVGLTIFYSRRNAKLISEIINGWENIRLIQLKNQNLSLSQYNELLTSNKFWENFNSEYVLIFQTDSIIFKQIPEIFFKFDYVGAPWSLEVEKNINDQLQFRLPRMRGNRCGNGGFSLRKVTKMKKITAGRPRSGYNEDVWFSKADMILPDLDLQSKFSCEECYSDDPVGCHKPFRMPKEKYDIFLTKIKEYIEPIVQADPALIES
tara:strand:- start:2886 stop:3683 length:798 start_codon:yes stop_codon:yes gene_type:complete